MNSLCENHQKHARFKCCVPECSQYMCTECLIHPHQECSTLFYCTSCMSKHTQKKCIVVCQHVTNPSTLQPHPVENDEQNEEVDLSSVKVQLFPADTPVPLHNEETSLTILPVEAVQDVTYDNERTLINLPAEVTTNECMPLAQTMNLTVTNTDNAQSLHLPTWYIETMTSDLEPFRIHSDISKRCWLTPELQEEIRRNYPTRDEIRVNPSMGDCVRDLEAFKVKCSYIFPVGRVFLSKIQFVQAAKHFLDGWNVKKVHHGKKIRCFFSDNI